MTNQERAQNIVSKILDDFKDRQGFKQVLLSVETEDPETYMEIQQDLINIVEKELNK